MIFTLVYLLGAGAFMGVVMVTCLIGVAVGPRLRRPARLAPRR